MLPYILILLTAQSALAASSVGIRLQEIDAVPRPVETSRSLVSPFIVSTAWESLDEGDTNIYILTIEQLLKDLAAQPDSFSQALALCQTVSVVGELASGRSGDACTFAELINAYVDSVASGSNGQLKAALAKYLGRLYYDIDAIAAINGNSVALRYESGPRGNCPGAGRKYNFEASWDALFTVVNPFQIGLVNEEYCAAKRLYNAWNERSNLVGAAVTACANPSVVKLFENSSPAVANFLRTIAYNGNTAQAAASAKSSLAQSLATL